MKPEGIRVQLSWNEVHMAATVGILRNIQALKQGRPQCHGAKDEEMWRYHVEGAAGELAFSKAMNIHWEAHSNVFKVPDIGSNLQIRTRSHDDWDLIVRDNDSDDEIFILLVGEIPNYRVVGWIRGVDAKRAEWYKDMGKRGKPAYFVPQEYLNPIELLPKSHE